MPDTMASRFTQDVRTSTPSNTSLRCLPTMDDHDEDETPCDEAQDVQDGPPRWRKPALLFTIALASGTIASGLWLKLHPRPIPNLASDAAVTLDPTHRALPAPMAGGSTNLPPPSTPAPGAPQLVSTVPDTASAAESTAVDEATGGAETEQGMASTEASAESPVVSTTSYDIGPQVLVGGEGRKKPARARKA